MTMAGPPSSYGSSDPIDRAGGHRDKKGGEKLEPDPDDQDEPATPRQAGCQVSRIAPVSGALAGFEEDERTRLHQGERQEAPAERPDGFAAAEPGDHRDDSCGGDQEGCDPQPAMPGVLEDVGDERGITVDEEIGGLMSAQEADRRPGEQSCGGTPGLHRRSISDGACRRLTGTR